MKKIAVLLLVLDLANLTAVDLTQELENASLEYITETYHKALQAFVEGKYQNSLQYIRHVIKSNFQDFRLRMLAGHNHWRLGNYESATIHFSKLAEISPEQPASYSNLAAMYLEQGLASKAASLLKQGESTLKAAAVRIPARYLNLQARAALALNQYREALRYITASRAIFSAEQDKPEDKLHALLLEGRVLLALGQFDKSVFALEWAASIAENDFYTTNLLGVAYLEWSTVGSEKEKKEKREKASQAFTTVINGQAPETLKAVARKNLEKLAS